METILPPFGLGEITSFDRVIAKAYEIGHEPGGIIALLTGRMRATLVEARRAHDDLMRDIPHPDTCAATMEIWRRVWNILECIDKSIISLAVALRNLEEDHHKFLTIIRK